MSKDLDEIINRLKAKWFVCRVTSGRKSALYGLRFSYPLYIALVCLGILFENLFLLSIMALIAFFGIILPMHPFDYLYNCGIAKLIRSERIPGRGSELQVTSIVALLFTIVVITLLVQGVRLNYTLMALLYSVSSVLFIVIQIRNDDFSFNSVYSFFKRGK